MSGEKKWSMENTCKLIELYREHPLLWDPKNRDYKNRFKKIDALNEIGSALGVASMEDIQKKIRNINNQYLRERRYYKTMKKSGAGTQFHSKWFGYELLSFLRDKFSEETQESDFSSSLDACNIDRESEQTTNTEIIEAMEAEHTTVTVYENKPTPTCSMPPKEKSKVKDINKGFKRTTIHKVGKQDNKVRKTGYYNILTSMIKEKQEKLQRKPDKFDAVGELVAQKLRGLRTPYAQSTVEYLIHKLLYEAEIGKYDTPNTTSSDLQYPMQQFVSLPRAPPSISSYSNPPSANTQHSGQYNSDQETSCSLPNNVNTYTDNISNLNNHEENIILSESENNN